MPRATVGAGRVLSGKDYRHSDCFCKTGGIVQMAKRTTAGTSGRQTSRKAGVTSTAKKTDSTRHGFGSEPAARKVTGAFGREGRGAARQAGASTAKRGKLTALGSMKGATRRG
jgi:hypothetical protein